SAITATNVASTPTATIPHPDTAVNEPAASIVFRMNARLSIARACSVGGSLGGGGLSCRTDVMRVVYRAVWKYVKYFALQSSAVYPQSVVSVPHSSAERNRAGEWIARGETLLDHLVQTTLIDRIGEKTHE